MVSALRIVDDSMLDRIEIATPCDQSWDRMRGDDQVRFCDRCRLNVYDISAMERAEAAALIRAHEGRICLRLFKRADGTLLTQDCYERLRRSRRSGLATFGCVLALSALPFAAIVCGKTSADLPAGVEHAIPDISMPMMGAPMPTPPTPPPGDGDAQELIGK